MPGLFEPFSEEAVRESVKRTKLQNRENLKREFDLAIDYLEDRQLEDVEQELLDRNPSSQTGDTGQQIFPVAIPLTRRYIEEAANAYNRSVKYKLVMEDGTENETTEEQTKKYNKHLDEILYGEFMYRNEQLTLLLKSNGVWYQHKRGRLEPQFVFPQNNYPVVPKNGHAINATSQSDYEAFIAEVFWATEDVSKTQKRTFAHIARGSTTFYEGEVDRVEKIVGGPYRNPFTWLQVPDGDPTKKPLPKRDLPLMPLTIWHKDMPLTSLLPNGDIPIANLNRELNILWTMLFDTLRFQGYDVPVKKLSNPDDPKARQRHGARFPVVLELDESFEYLHSNVSYTQIVDVLVKTQKIVALLERMSPNDFAIEGGSIASGFAKLIDSLPKIEARTQRIRRLTFYETQIAFPRIVSILVWIGILDPVAKQMRLQVEFPDIEIPRTPQEEAFKNEHDIKYNLTTPAHIYAKRHGVSVEDAKEQVMTNAELNAELKAANPEQMQQPQQQGFAFNNPVGNRLGGRIGRRGRDEQQDADGSSRRDRQQGGSERPGPTDRRPGNT